MNVHAPNNATEFLGLDAAKRECALVAGAEDASINFRLIEEPKQEGKDASIITLSGTVEKHWPEIQKWNANGFGAFFVPNVGGYHDHEITDIRAVFIDMDSNPMPAKWLIRPDFIVQRGEDRWQAFWLVNNFPLSRFREIQKRLITHYDSDDKVHNPARLMRLAGTNNLKTGAPIPHKLIDYTNGAERWELGHTIEEIETGLPILTMADVDARIAAAKCEVDSDNSKDWIKGFFAHYAPSIQGKYGNAHALQAFHKCHDRALTKQTALNLAEPWNKTNQPPFPNAELETLADNAYRYHDNEFGCDCIPSAKERMGQEAFDNLNAENAAASDKKNRFDFKTHKEFLEQAPPKWIIKDFLPKDDITPVFGPSDAGKTYVVLDMGFSVATKTPFLNHFPILQSGHVFAFLAERADDCGRNRWPALIKSRKWTDDIPNWHWSREIPLLATIGDFEAAVAAIEKVTKEPVLIIFDNYTLMMRCQDENSTKDAGSFGLGCDILKEKFPGVAIVPICHVTKGAKGQGTIRGSGVTLNNPSVAINVTATEDGCKLRWEKHRIGGKKPDPVFCKNILVKDPSIHLGQDRVFNVMTGMEVAQAVAKQDLGKITGQHVGRALLSLKAIEPASVTSEVLLTCFVKDLTEYEQDNPLMVAAHKERRKVVARQLQRGAKKNTAGKGGWLAGYVVPGSGVGSGNQAKWMLPAAWQAQTEADDQKARLEEQQIMEETGDDDGEF